MPVPVPSAGSTMPHQRGSAGQLEAHSSTISSRRHNARPVAVLLYPRAQYYDGSNMRYPVRHGRWRRRRQQRPAAPEPPFPEDTDETCFLLPKLSP